MLFPLDRNTPQCEIFRVLNSEVLFFLEASIEAPTFVEDLFSEYEYGNDVVRSACWTNEPTMEKFEALWRVLPQETGARRELFDLVSNAQNIASYFSDISIAVPELRGDDLFEAFKSLTSHLFTSSKGLKSIQNQAGGSIEQHFQSYRATNHNTQLCYLCGMEALSQDRSGVDADEQWRADYDHILCKDKYPIYSAHPGNFIPTCDTCNRKAKGAKDMLFCQSKNRRPAFYPLPPETDSCYLYASVIPVFRTLGELINGIWLDPLSATKISFPEAPADISSKIDVWEEVYQVPGRVAAEISASFCDRVNSDLMAQNFHEFCTHLSFRVTRVPTDCRKAPGRFWWQKVYEYLDSLSDEKLYDVWLLVKWRLDASKDDDMYATFDY